MERFEPERNGPKLEDFGWKNGGGSSEQVRESKKAKKEAFRSRGAPLGMEKGVQKQDIQNKKDFSRIFFLFRENNLQRQQST